MPDISVVGVDVGGTKIAARRFDPRGTAGKTVRLATPHDAGSAAMVSAIAHAVRDAAGGMPLAGIGIGTAGVVEPRSGRILAATDHISGWAGTALADTVAAEAGAPVRVVNDVHAHALGEYERLGLDGDLLALAIGTGIGGSVLRDGVPLIGAHSLAGHLGHIPSPLAQGIPCSCGLAGHVEAVGSGAAILAGYRRAGGSAASTHEVVARMGDDPAAADAVLRSADAVALMAGGLVNTLDPGAVLVSGGIATIEPWWERFSATVAEQILPAARGTRILRGEHPDTACAGAARLWDEELWRRILGKEPS